jgi:protein-tyrosine phosphatase/arsenate reductase
VEAAAKSMLYPAIKSYCEDVIRHFSEIPAERKLLLERISKYVSNKKLTNEVIQLVYVCTHNSRRSHFGQIWAQVAATFYGIKDVHAFSGGTESTAFHPNAIPAVQRAGCRITAKTQEQNPHYLIRYSDSDAPISCFSKVYSDPVNPQFHFAAIMTCSDAEQNCPFIPNVELRVATTYDDPKTFDNTALQDEKYDERCRQIALENLYVFSLVK